MDIFKWAVSGELGTEYVPHVREVKFGDGVTQTQATSLKKFHRIFNLSVKGTLEDLKDPESFLRVHTAKRFKWTTPDQNENLIVRCTKLSRRSTGLNGELQLEFTEEFL